jgi:hypothetical protein
MESRSCFAKLIVASIPLLMTEQALAVRSERDIATCSDPNPESI